MASKTNLAEVPLVEPSAQAQAAADAKKAQLRAQLQRGQERMKELRAQGVQFTHKNPVEQAQANPTSLKRAVKAFCWTCVGGDGDPGAKFRVRDCTAPKCALHPHRPWQDAKGRIQVGDAGVAEPTNESEDTSED
jgi:hypothetical protein